MAIVAADIDGDGAQDLVTADYYGILSNGTVTLFRGRSAGSHGDGTFLPPLTYPLAGELAPKKRGFDLVADDFNEDGRVDLAVLNNDCAGSLIILMAQSPSPSGEPRFGAPNEYGLGCKPAGIASGDFNEDGHVDLVITVFGTGELKSCLGAGDGTFAIATIATGLSKPFEVDAADLDEDGILDLVVGGGASASPGLLILWGLGSAGVGNGTFDLPVYLAGQASPAVAIGDQNGDGLLDIVAGGGGAPARLLLGGPGRAFQETTVALDWIDVIDPVIADIDADGRGDLIAPRYSSSSVSWISSACRQAAPPAPRAGAWSPHGIAIAPSAMSQTQPTMLPDGQGGVVILWVENASVTSGTVLMQRLGSGGERLLEPAGRRVCEETTRQTAPGLISDGGSGFYVSWMDDRSGELRQYVKRITRDGEAASGWPTCGKPVGIRRAGGGPWGDFPASLLLDQAGSVWVGILEYTPYIPEARLFRFEASGAAVASWPSSGLLVNRGYSDSDGSFDQLVFVRLYLGGSGGVNAVTLHDHSSCSHPFECTHSWNTQVRSVSSAGAITFRREYPLELFAVPALVDLRQGRAMYSMDETDGPLQTTSLDAGGAALWTATLGPGPSSIAPQLTRDDGTGTFVVWDAAGGWSRDLFTTRLASTGERAPGSRGSLLVSEAGFQGEPAVTHDGYGGFAVAWRDDRNGNADIYFQHMDGEGRVRFGWPKSGSPLVELESAQMRPKIALADPRSVVVLWEDSRQAQQQLFAQRIELDQPVPVTASVQSTLTSPGHAKVVWKLETREGLFEIDRGTRDGQWLVQGQARASGEGWLTWDDPGAISGSRHGYRLRAAGGRDVVPGSEIWVDIPNGYLLALGGFDPNPAEREIRVSFTLPHEAPADLELFDLFGRRISAREVGGMGAGRHRILLSAGLNPGVYAIRLKQAGLVRIRRGVVLK